MGVFTRDQTALTMCDYDGSVVGSLQQEPWLDLVPGLPRRDPEGRLLAWEDGERRHLTMDGMVVAPEANLRSLVGVMGEHVYLLACDDPADSRLARVGPEGLRWLSDPGRYVTATVGAGLIVTSEVSWGEYRAEVRIRDSDYTVLAEIENLAEEPVVAAHPQRLVSPLNTVQSVVLMPSAQAEEPLPILMYPYGGPHAQRVLAARGAYSSAQWLADQGFCVVVADGRGTPGQSPAWEHSVAGDLRDPALEDQVVALQAVLDEHGERLDADRVGILGWSYGGYLAALAVLHRPDVFHAAVAGAPVTDWRLYDTAYTERYLGDPRDGSRTLRPLLPARSRATVAPPSAADPRPVGRQRLRRAHPPTVH